MGEDHKKFMSNVSSTNSELLQAWMHPWITYIPAEKHHSHRDYIQMISKIPHVVRCAGHSYRIAKRRLSIESRHWVDFFLKYCNAKSLITITINQITINRKILIL